MIEDLGQHQLRNGERIRMAAIQGPEGALGGEVISLLGHKGEEWRAHVTAALAGGCGRLETRFHIAYLSGQAVANVMTVETHGIGILGHVYTKPEHRQKGIAKSLFAATMAHFKQRSGQVLLLGTGFESVPYWLYHGFGFRSLRGGFMRFAASEAPETSWFATASAGVVPCDWRHWPQLALLASVPTGEEFRSVAWGLRDIGNLEGPYVAFMHRCAHDPMIRGVVLEGANGAALGAATVTPWSLGPDRGAWPGVWLVDAFAHPDHSDRLRDLVSALPCPPGKQMALVPSGAAARVDALVSAGFRHEGACPGMLGGASTTDLLLLGRQA